MSRDLAVSGDPATGCRNRPDVDGRHLVIAPGKQLEFRIRQGYLIENERVVPAAVEVKKRGRPEQSVLPTERQDAFGIERKVSGKDRRRHLNARDHAMGHVCQDGKFAVLREPHLNIRAGRQ